jgi:hypothetical protein
MKTPLNIPESGMSISINGKLTSGPVPRPPARPASATVSVPPASTTSK